MYRVPRTEWPGSFICPGKSANSLASIPPLEVTVNNTGSPTDTRKNQLPHKCGNDDSLGLCHVIRMCCV